MTRSQANTEAVSHVGCVFNVPGGVAQVLGFLETDLGWVRVELQVSRKRPRWIRSVTCCGPDDFSGHAPDADDQSCEECLWGWPHTMHLHDRQSGRLLS
jgi:hypothetical protein